MRELLVVEIPCVVSFAYIDIVTRVALGKQRQTYEYSFKRKLMDRCIGLSFGSMLAVVWGFWGFWACFCLLVPCAPFVAWIHFGSILAVKWLPRGWILKVLGSI